MKVINDLYDYGLKIVQDSKAFKFSLDSILLAEFVDKLEKNQKVLDICTGNAAIPLILATKYKNPIVGMEIQKEIYDLALESIAINNLKEQINVINDDAKSWKNYFPGNNFDIVLANPPYFKYQNSSIINDMSCKAIARHEIYLDLHDCFRVAWENLKDRGVFYLVHLPDRLQEILTDAENFKFRVKKIQFVYTNENKEATVVLFKFVKNGNNGVKIKPLLLIQNNKSYKNIFRK